MKVLAACEESQRVCTAFRARGHEAYSCEMGRKSFAVTHGIDLDNDYMTVQEFIELTKDSFGGQVIRKLAEVYDRKKCGYVQHVRIQEGKKVEQI